MSINIQYTLWKRLTDASILDIHMTGESKERLHSYCTKRNVTGKLSRILLFSVIFCNAKVCQYRCSAMSVPGWLRLSVLHCIILKLWLKGVISSTKVKLYYKSLKSVNDSIGVTLFDVYDKTFELCPIIIHVIIASRLWYYLAAFLPFLMSPEY